MLIGAHESTAGGVSTAFARAEQHGAKAIQIFTRSARAWRSPRLTVREERAFHAEAERTGVPAVAHGSYLANLASADEAVRRNSIRGLADELRRCDRLGVAHLVFHPGSHADLAEGLRLAARGLDEVVSRASPRRARLCLEVTAGQGNCLGWRFEHLAEILSRASSGDRAGVCLDTCHLFAAGYDLRTRRGYERVIRELDRTLGIGRVACFHLNDSKRSLGSRVDRHEDVGKGALGLSPFRYLVNDARFARVPGVLETPHPERYAQSIRLLKSMVHL